MKTYKIDPSKIAAYTNRTNNRVLKVIAMAMVALLLLKVLARAQGTEAPEPLYMEVLPLLITLLVIALIYFNNKKLTRIMAENLRIIVDDRSVTRIIDLGQESRLNFFHKIGIERAKNISSTYYSRLEFSEIKSMEEKKGNLWITGAGASTLNGKNIVLVPLELAHYEELKQEISDRIKQ